MLKLMGKEIFTILSLKKVLILTYGLYINNIKNTQCGLIGACVVNRSKDGINNFCIFSDQERRIGRQQSC